MKVFISWSGERSEALARALRDWFPLVLHYVDPWLSQSDIQAGERWGIEVAQNLESCNFGVICVTRENLNASWLLFEAGALAKSMQDGRVIPLLLDLDFKEISGPLSQFQAKKADGTGIKELASSLNKVASSPVPDGQFDKLFAALWSDLDKNITEIPKSAPVGKHTRPQGEILEELVSSVRGVEMRMRDVSDDDPFMRRRRKHRYHPGMIHEVIHEISESPGDPIQILIIASLFREDFPWIYELGVNAYRDMTTFSVRDRRKALNRLFKAIDMIQRGSFLEEFGGDRMAAKFLRNEIFDMLDHIRPELYEAKSSAPSMASKRTKKADQ